MRKVRNIDLLDNHQANILYGGFGILAHEDIQAIRQAKVSVIHAGSPSYVFGFEQGDLISIKSDGINVNVTKLKS